jgi:transcriptional regulator with XRE-family HTH domain
MTTPKSFDDYEDFFGPYLGPILSKVRKAKGLSQVGLAERVRIGDATLRRIENGAGPMRPKVIAAICKELDVLLDDVVLEALFSFWKDFQRRASEGTAAGATSILGPYQRMRDRIFERYEANVRTGRELMEANLDLQAFIHFKMRLDTLGD